MDAVDWLPMDTAPRDGREILAKLPRRDVFMKVAWDGRRWVCGTIPITSIFQGWSPLEPGPDPTRSAAMRYAARWMRVAHR